MSSFNPYQAPNVPNRAVGVLSGRREDVLSVAKYQKGVIFCILFNIISVIAVIMLPSQFKVLGSLSFWAVGIVQMVFVFLLSTKVFGMGLGILFGILALIPCIGLIVLLVINNKATTILKQNGFQVGLLGAKT